mmetsp:Transcript_26269/g.39368  ORF Transcript_26269/g.39368 Transcript_26269/m.39368 type:complete len:375 (+) Transcript_26269:236-1360(+)
MTNDIDYVSNNNNNMNELDISHLRVDVDNQSNSHCILKEPKDVVDDSSIVTDAKTYIHEKLSEEDEEVDDSDETNEEYMATKTVSVMNETSMQEHQSLETVMEAVTDVHKEHSWSQPGAQIFRVRGRSYMKDAIKVNSEEHIFRARGVDFLLTKEFGPSHIGRHANILGGKLRDIPTFIINFRFAWGVLVLYHEIPKRYLPILRQKNVPPERKTMSSSTTATADNFISLEKFLEQYNTPHDRAMYNFIMGDDTYRNSKLKLIPKVAEGNLVVRRLVKGKPVIIGKKLPVSYIYEPADPSRGMAEFWECDLDIGSSSATAKKIVGVCKKYISSLTVDLGFVIEGDTEGALPERILTTTRIHHLDVERCQLLRCAK